MLCSSSIPEGQEILMGREAGDTEEEKEWMSEVMDAGGQKGSRRETMKDPKTLKDFPRLLKSF